MKRGFTLIELLVVIAIIAILAAILFPVFSQAKEGGRKAVCLSNLRQNSAAVMMYNSDNDDTFGMIVYMANGDGTFAGCGPSRGNLVWANIDATMPYSKSKPIFRCPTKEDAIPWGAMLTAFGLASEARIPSESYAPNVCRFEDTSVCSPYGNRNPVVMRSMIPEPSITTMFYDSKYLPRNGLYEDFPDQYLSANPYASRYRVPLLPFSQFNISGFARHNNGLNVNYADGHFHSYNRNAVLPGDATDDLSPTVPIRVYNLPYDLNGIPGVIAEAYPPRP